MNSQQTPMTTLDQGREGNPSFIHDSNVHVTLETGRECHQTFAGYPELNIISSVRKMIILFITSAFSSFLRMQKTLTKTYTVIINNCIHHFILQEFSP